MKAHVAITLKSGLRLGLLLTVSVVGFLLATGVALAGGTPSHGGPGAGADTGGSLGELVAVVIILAVAAAAILYEASRRPERAAAKRAKPVTAPGARQHTTA